MKLIKYIVAKRISHYDEILYVFVSQQFRSFNTANEERIYLQPDFDELLVVIKQTSEVVYE